MYFHVEFIIIRSVLSSHSVFLAFKGSFAILLLALSLILSESFRGPIETQNRQVRMLHRKKSIALFHTIGLTSIALNSSRKLP
jgi:hypothetical protein